MPERGNVLKGRENTPVFFKCVAGAELTIKTAKLAYGSHQAINGNEQGRCEGSRRTCKAKLKRLIPHQDGVPILTEQTR